MRPAKKALAASFVMTFAAGCDNTSAAPPAAPTVDVGSNAPAAGSATPTSGSSSGSAAGAADAGATQPLPPTPSAGFVEVEKDGTCMWHAPPCPRAANGRVMPCNPPMPHLVQCPPDAGAPGTSMTLGSSHEADAGTP